MKYEYTYRTPDGIRHVEEMESPSRDEVFASLRKRGIKAIKVVAKDGSKANGEIRVVGVKKRVTFGLLIIVAIISASVALSIRRTQVAVDATRTVVTNTVPVAVAISSQAVEINRRIAMPLPRQVIQGDRRRIEMVPTNLFAYAEELYLSKFAEPGRDFRSTAAVVCPTNTQDWTAILNAPIYTSDNEFTEYVDLKRITAGIKREMRVFLRGGQTAQEYLEELVRRQDLEKSYRDRAEKKIQVMVAEKAVDKKALYDFWLKANAQLQSMGIYPLALPDILRDFQMPFDLE